MTTPEFFFLLREVIWSASVFGLSTGLILAFFFRRY